MAHSENNRILERLAPETFRQISSSSRHVELAQGETLAEPMQRLRSVYFPLHGVVSFVVELSEGDMVETGMIGNDGIVGADEAINDSLAFNRIVVQVAGAALVVSADRFRQLHATHESLRAAVADCRQVFVAQAQQTGGCNAVHNINSRLCRWLLRVRDLAGDEFHLTQEFIAQMLGVQRASVSVEAHKLQEAGLIHYARGNITITDLSGLRAAACHCYEDVKRYEAAVLKRVREMEDA